MKRATASTKQDTYQISGSLLQIYWDEKEHHGETETYYSYAYCNAKVSDDYRTLVQKIIHSQYGYDDELALIHNQDELSDDYVEYQAFRQLAKQLANNYIGQSSG